MAESSNFGTQMDRFEPKALQENGLQPAFIGGEAYEMAESHVKYKYQGTDTDKKDMGALGKTQELRRNFRFLSIMAFACTQIASWEVLASALPIILTNGGTAGLLWGFIIVFTGNLMVYLSIAELVSMAPTAGGQYHWVSEWAPEKAQKILSYIVGWLCVVGWNCGLVSIAFFTGGLIQGVIVLNHPESYVPQAWHSTLLIIAVTAFAIIFNTVLAKRLPLVEALLLVLHVLGFPAIIIPLWLLSPIAPAEQVWTEFSNQGGWNSNGTAVLVGLVGPLVALGGYDCAVHMAEEVRDAAVTMPRAMLTAFCFNGLLAFVTGVTLAFCLGDAESILNTPTGSPAIQIFFNATGSLTGTTIMSLILILTLQSSVIASLATTSRQLWSFARDKGVPFNGFLARITPGSNIPLNSVLMSMAFTVVLALINLGSTAALNAVLSLTAVSLSSSYIIAISCVVYRRFSSVSLPPRRWSLGKMGLPINIAALCYTPVLFVFVLFPQTSEVTAESMNYGVVMFGGIMTLAMVYYYAHGRHVYVSPVALVKRQHEL